MNKRLNTILVCIGIVTMTVITTACGKTDKEVIENNQTSIQVNNNTPEESEISQEELEISDTVGNDNMTFTVEASSILKETVSGKTKVYSLLNISDNNLTTAWVEGSEGDGVGEWISFSSQEKFDLDRLHLTNGYSKSESLYYKNNRIAEIEVISSAGEKRYFDFKDNKLSMQTFNVGFKDITGIKIVISKIYKGTKYNDVCISEINFNKNSLDLIISENNAAPTEVKRANDQPETPVINEESVNGSYSMNFQGGGFFDKDFQLIEKYNSMRSGVQCVYNFALLENGKVSTNEGADSYYAGNWFSRDGKILINWDSGSSDSYISKNGVLFREFIIQRHSFYNFNANINGIVYEGYGKEHLSWEDYPPEDSGDSSGMTADSKLNLKISQTTQRCNIFHDQVI